MPKPSLWQQKSQQPAPQQPAPQQAVATTSGAMPAVAAKFGAGMANYVPPPPSSEYVQFISSRASNWASIQQQLPGVAELSPVLIRSGKPLLLMPLKFMVPDAWQYWDHNANGTTTKIFTEPTEGASENLLLFTLLFTSEGIIAAHMSLRGAQCRLGSVAMQTYAIAMTDDWVLQSDAHKLTANVNRPWLRFWATGSMEKETSKSTGQIYFKGNGQCFPTSPQDWLAATQYLESENGAVQVEKAYLSFLARKEYLMRLK